MKKIVRKTIIALAVIVGALCPGRMAAQVVVANPTGLANDIYQFIEQNFQHAEVLQQYAKELQVSLQNLENVRQNLEMVRKTFSVASAYFKDASILVDTYDNLETIYRDIDRLNKRIQYYSDGGNVTPTNVYTTTKMIGEISGRAYDTWVFAKDQVLSSDNNLTLHERMEQLDKINKEFRRYHNIFLAMNKIVSKDDEEEKEEEYSDGMEAMKDLLTANNPVGKPTKEDKQDISEAVTEAITGVENDVELAAGDTDSSPAPVSKAKSGDFKRNVIHISMYGITLLAILFFGWNFGVYNHGDRQRSDVLWKVGAGYLVMMIVLSVFDRMFYFNL